MSQIWLKYHDEKHSRDKEYLSYLSMNSMRPPKLEIALLQITDMFNKHAGSDQKIQKGELKKMLQSGFALF